MQIIFHIEKYISNKCEDCPRNVIIGRNLNPHGQKIYSGKVGRGGKPLSEESVPGNGGKSPLRSSPGKPGKGGKSLSLESGRPGNGGILSSPPPGSAGSGGKSLPDGVAFGKEGRSFST